MGSLAVAATVGGLTACSPPTERQAAAASSPRSGGTLRVAAPGSSGDSLDPHHNPAAVTDLMRIDQLYEGLTERQADYSVTWALAEAMEPNADLSEWTVTLRQGVRWHDGRPFTAADVVASIERILDPANPSIGANQLAFATPGASRVVDDHTAVVACTVPYGAFRDIWTSSYLKVVPADFAPENPVGTGPFAFSEFRPGQSSTFTRNDAYWGEKALVDELVITDFADNEAAINALRGGQVDITYAVPPSSAAALDDVEGITVLDSETSMYIPIVMRTDVAPFNDVRVREAMRLIADRQELVDTAVNGRGAIANDWVGRYDVDPPDVVQRTQDLRQARDLLAEAGQSGLEVELATTNGTAGMVECAQVFAEQAKAAGVTLTVRNLDVASFLANYGEWTMATDFYSSPYLEVAATTLLPGGSGNATHWDDEEFVEVVAQAVATVDETERSSLLAQARAIEYERGGNIVWGWVNVVNAHLDTVQGLKPDSTGRAVHRLAGAWLA